MRSGALHLGCTAAEALALLVLAAGAVGLLGIVWWQQRPVTGSPAPLVVTPPSPTGREPVAAQATPTPASISVHVTGHVSRPGVYQLDSDARVVDAVSAAGGATSEADLEAVNMAAPLTDGAQVRVPAPGEPSTQPLTPLAAHGSQSSTDPAPVDLNTADSDTLQTLPGIGPVTARRIIDHRNQSQGFRSVEELLEVRGIGEATLADLAGKVIVSE